MSREGTENESNKIPKLLYYVMGLQFTQAMSNSVIGPIFPLYMTYLGASIFEIGIMMTLTSVVTLLSRIPMSTLSDKIQRWPIILFGLLCSFLYLVLLAFIPGLLWLYPLRALYRILSSGYQPTSHAIVSDLAPSGRRSETLGLALTAVGLSSMLGPALCSLLVSYFNYSQIFLIVAIFPLFGFLSFIATKNLFNISINPKQRGAKDAIKPMPFFSILKLKNMPNMCFFEFAMSFAGGAFATLFSIYAKDKLLMGVSLISLLFSVRGLTNTIIRIPTGKISDRIGRMKPLYAATILLSFAFLSLSVAQNFYSLCIVMIFYGIGFGMYKVTSNTLFVENVPPENRAVSLSIRFTSMSIGTAVGALFAGSSAMVLPITSIFILCSLVILMGLGVFSLSRFDLLRNK